MIKAEIKEAVKKEWHSLSFQDFNGTITLKND